MRRFGLVRPDGVPRIAVVCESCARRAANVCCEERLHYWLRAFDGTSECEFCYINDFQTSAAG